MYKIFNSVLYILIVIIYLPFLKSGTLSFGDWLYRYPQGFTQFLIPPSLWDPLAGDTLGANVAFLLALNTYYVNTVHFFLSVLHLPWELCERIVWYIPFICISFFSTKYLYIKLYRDHNSFFSSLAGFIYTTNSYILLVVGGGQIAIGIAYALFPLVFLSFYNVINNKNVLKNSNREFAKAAIVSGLLFSLQVFFDIRFAYISFFVVIILLLFSIKTFIKKIHLLFFIVIPFCLTVLLHAFWLIPLVTGGKNPVIEMGSAYASLEALQFFSFAKLENTLAFMHPFWPENIFGKVGFMNSLFFIYPLIGFSSLLFLSKSKNKSVLLFLILSLLGIFLAKGSNEPFGFIYAYLFQHFPGFEMFRDPTKWYTLIAISFSLLIPFSIQSYINLFNSKKIFFVKYKSAVLIITLLILLLPTKEALFGKVQGTFKPQLVPNDYQKLAQFLSQDSEYYRTLWIPQPTNYAYSSYIHPRVSASSLFQKSDLSPLLKKISKEKIQIQNSAIKYIIVPYATRGELFQVDRKYSPSEYFATIAYLRNIPWLTELPGFGSIKVFRMQSTNDHLWLQNSSNSKNIRSITMINPSRYIVSLQNVRRGDVLYFSEGFDTGWKLQSNEVKIASKKFNKINTFQLPKNGSYNVAIIYETQKYVVIGTWISSISLFVVLLTLFYLFKKR